MDSDEEYDRRRGRDKFRRERNDYDRNRDDRRRDGPIRRESWGRGHHDGGGRRDQYNSRDDYRMRRDRYNNSPPRRDFSPPPKRIRRDWDDVGGSFGGDHFQGGRGGGGFEPRGQDGPGASTWNEPKEPSVGGFVGAQAQQPRPEVNFPTQPAMQSFKQFLSEQDDLISDEEAVKKFAEYKMDFRKNQINEFFLNHKEEEW